MSARIQTLGDPHLGRVFKTGVPLDRRGDRENMVREQFVQELVHMEGHLDYHVNMGDLFDGFVVPLEDIIFAARVYEEAARTHPGVKFVILEGNHDASKDSSRSSAFDLFELLVDDHSNIKVVREVPYVIDNMGFVPFHPFTTALEMIDLLPDDLDVIFTHFDYTDFGGEHVLPTERLAEKGIKKVVNGHDHLARTEKRHGVTVEITGSMQPYTHAEDDSGKWYKTVTLDQLEDLRNTKNLNIRVLLKEGETLPDGIDCLSLTAKRVVEDQEDEDLEVDTEDFDTFEIGKALAEAVDERVRDEIMEVFNR